MNPWPELVPEALGTLQILRIECLLTSQAETHLPEYLGSTLRGSLAMAMRQMVCTYGNRPCDGCPVQASCHYPNLFETPSATGTQEIRRMRDIPHPIVIEPPVEHRQRYLRGDPLRFEIVLIGKAVSRLPYLAFAVNEMANTGLGVQRSPFMLQEIRDHTGEIVYDIDSGKLSRDVSGMTLRELFDSHPVLSPVKLVLETPLRMKSEGSLMTRRLDPDMFLKQSCRRLWALLTQYEDIDPDQLDFRPLLAETPMPRVVQSSLKWWDLERYSNRQKTKMKVGGMVGHTVWDGNIKPWWPILLAITQVHAGKGAVMGLGRIRLEQASST
ncbi:MAG TPA: CRISPR system precrRNA processing endoribonuclease RAMP protein Cas6 [bacterium]|nr:CRISPR system precrRNA processing endoribonuclease RAMP protein Cas6 [bacterium]